MSLVWFVLEGCVLNIFVVLLCRREVKDVILRLTASHAMTGFRIFLMRTAIVRK